MSEVFTLDAWSLRILQELQRDARQTLQQIADAVGLSPTPCWRRIKAMEDAGVIRGYSALVDRSRVGLSLLVVVEVNLAAHTEELVRGFERAVAAEPAIVRCLSTTGQADYILTVMMPDIAAYERFLHATLFKLPGVTHVRSSIVLKEIKADVRLPVAALASEAAAPSTQAHERRARTARGGPKS
ncbi:Lrp/AsnC family transcriptional regulator [Tibeticola sp.]|jgi:DNA-binding Lrp family transcriptional regulator|uniref:Lrp/AsnC family transcriptional regulator n=1 Tax=Tibeticola sp. TaxID=2005368 RepID=UPI00258E1740|nr:Lrp/AsnC family transcriptional regulator [Tibeticola sp.]MCI4440761.1 Lrp/AsnC family transcriptional regulator [Tibeticola sp.]